MLLHIRANKNISLSFDDTDFDLWQKAGSKGEIPELVFIPHLQNQKHKVTMQDIEDVNAKISEIWQKYPRFGRYNKPEISKPQDLLGEDHALVLT